MTETELAALCAAITPPDEAARAAAHAHWASLAKPLGGLGGLETTIEDAAALTGSAKLDISRRAVLVYDEEKSAFTLLPGSSQELCYLGGDAALTPQPLTGGETLRMGGAAMKFVPFCGAEFHW